MGSERISNYNHLGIIITGALTVLLIAILSVPCFAVQKTYSSGYYYYVVEDESVAITGYFGPETETEVPSSIAGYPVSKICKGAFKDSKKLKTIYLPDTIMTIEAGSFSSDQKVIHDRGDNSSSGGSVTENGTTETPNSTAEAVENGQNKPDSSQKNTGKSSDAPEEVTGSNGTESKGKTGNDSTNKSKDTSKKDSANSNISSSTNKSGTIEPANPEDGFSTEEHEETLDQDAFSGQTDSDQPSHGLKSTFGWVLLAITIMVLAGGVIWHFIQKGKDREY